MGCNCSKAKVDAHAGREHAITGIANCWNVFQSNDLLPRGSCSRRAAPKIAARRDAVVSKALPMEVAMVADEGAFIGGVALTMTAITLLVSNQHSIKQVFTAAFAHCPTAALQLVQEPGGGCCMAGAFKLESV